MDNEQCQMRIQEKKNAEKATQKTQYPNATNMSQVKKIANPLNVSENNFNWDWCILLGTAFKFAIIGEVFILYICVLMCF